MYKDNAVGTVVVETGLAETVGQRHDCTERSFNAVSASCIAVERRGSKLTWTACKIGGSRQPAKNGKFIRRAYSREALDCKKKTILCFVSSLSTPRPLLRGGMVGGKRERFDMAARSEIPKASCQSHKQWQLRPCTGPSKEAHTPAKDSEYRAKIERGIKLLNTKNYWKEKRKLCVNLFEVTNTPEKIWKWLQSTTQYNVRSGHCFMRCNFQIFSGWVCHLEQLHTQFSFLFPIVFGINHTLNGRKKRQSTLFPQRLTQLQCQNGACAFVSFISFAHSTPCWDEWVGQTLPLEIYHESH